MKDFKFLQTLADQPPEKVLETQNETEYLIYVLSDQDVESKIGVPVNMVESFDDFIANEQDMEVIKDNFARFNVIELN